VFNIEDCRIFVCKDKSIQNCNANCMLYIVFDMLVGSLSVQTAIKMRLVIVHNPYSALLKLTRVEVFRLASPVLVSVFYLLDSPGRFI